MGAGHQKDKAMIRSLELSGSTVSSGERARVNPACMSDQSFTVPGSGSLPGWLTHPHCARMVCTTSVKALPVTCVPLHLAAQGILDNILFNELVDMSISLISVSIIANYYT